MTNMLASGFHSSREDDEILGGEGSHGDEAEGTEGGTTGEKAPSSRSLSYTIMVPSAWETINKVGEEGTQRTEVHAALDMQPCAPGGGSFSIDDNDNDETGRTCLFNLP